MSNISNKVISVNISKKEATSYPIIIGEDLLNKAGELISKYTKAKKLAVVTNTTVYGIYGEILKSSLGKSGFEHTFIILEDGEKYKSMDSLETIWTKTLEYKLERKDAFVALGGGVVGDITGFAAATYLRGIDFIQIPTTLLAQVDSSVGGKVAINHPLGKNMLGAFYQPKLVLADIKTLNTLPLEQLKTGLCEVIKYGFIEKTCALKNNKNEFLEYLNANKNNIYNLNSNTIIEVIKHCCELKAAVVNQDEKEAGLRAILNFGHTIGHAIERCTNYEVFTHGQAVSMGMKGALKIAKQKELIDEGTLNNSIELIEYYELNYKIPANIIKEDILKAMIHDKKVISNKVRFVLSTNTNEVSIFDDVDDKTILKALDSLY